MTIYLRTILFGLLALTPLLSTQASEPDIERGKYLLHAGGCITCHTLGDEKDTVLLAGGRALETPFGIFYTPNITPDPVTGIGAWSFEEFRQALQAGVRPAGGRYYPTFPYTAYSGMLEQDVRDLWAYLQTLPPVQRENREHDLSWYVSWRFAARAWQWLNFEPQVFQPDPTQSEDWNRGAYLVRHLGHCGECHTPRNWAGALDEAYFLAGNPDGPEGDAVPNITNDPDNGIGSWSASDISYFLEIGMLPDGDFAGSSMGAVIDDNTSHLSAEDRTTIAAFLRTVEPPEED